MALQIAEKWFELRRVDDDITHLWEPYADPYIQCNIWHVRGRDRDLLIDTGLPDLGMPIPADAQHVHFGDGSTSTEITLEPGEHTLQMLLGDHLHIPHDPPLASGVITITVEAGEAVE